MEQGGLYFTGFWRFEDFIVYKAFGLESWELARRVYLDHGNWIRVGMYEITYIILFFVVVFGVNILSIFQTKKSLSFLPKEVHLLLIPSIILSLILGSLFQQKVGGANTSQFIITVLMIVPIYTALALTFWLHKLHKTLRYFIIIVIVLLSIPRVIYFGNNQFSIFATKGGYVLTEAEEAAITYISNNTPKDSVFLLSSESTQKEALTYIFPVLTGRDLYLAGVAILKDHGVDITQRQRVQKNVFSETKPYSKNISSLIAHVDYIYRHVDESSINKSYRYFLKRVYRNDRITIYKVDKELAKKYLQTVKRNELKNE